MERDAPNSSPGACGEGSAQSASRGEASPPSNRAPETATPAAAPSPQAAEDSLKAWEDRYRRLYADFENYRRRAQREKKEAADAARGDVIRDLLSVLDHLDRAIRSARDHGVPEPFVEGLRLIESEFQLALSRWGVQEVSTEGPFDVLWHEAVGCQVSEHVPEGEIVAVTRKGYRLGDRLLRPAQVVVSTGPSAGTPAGGPGAAQPTAPDRPEGKEEALSPPPAP